MKGKWSVGVGVYSWKGLDWVGCRVYGLKVFGVGRVLVGSDDSVGVLAGCEVGFACKVLVACRCGLIVRLALGFQLNCPDATTLQRIRQLVFILLMHQLQLCFSL